MAGKTQKLRKILRLQMEKIVVISQYAYDLTFTPQSIQRNRNLHYEPISSSNGAFKLYDKYPSKLAKLSLLLSLRLR
ncbi:unnamed protein product [Absidia cylindrospora]